MSNIFEEVALQWRGKEYVVSPDKVMGLVEVVEDIITIEELARAGVKRARIARAFAAAIRYAGQCQGAFVKISEQDVYQTLFGDDALVSTTATVNALLALMIPPQHLQVNRENTNAKSPAPRKVNAKGSSKRRT